MTSVAVSREGFAPDDVCFGAFRLHRARRSLEKDGRPVRIGGRAFDILLALVESAPEVVDQDALIARAWPHATVGESSLRYHIAALRKAMGPGASGRSPIVNVAGRGYGLVEPVRATPDEALPAQPQTVQGFAQTLPPILPRMIGREDVCTAVETALLGGRFLSVVGPAGIGKTTVAVAVAHRLHERLGERIVFVDFSSAHAPPQAAESVLAALNLPVSSSNPYTDIVEAVRGGPTLLVLDSCEHLVDPIAAFAERIFRDAPLVNILATTRESLRVEGEQVYRLFPLAVPPEDASGDGMSVRDYAAVELFMERVAASGHVLDRSEATTALVVDICRRLDGIALALELVASRVGVYGLAKTAELLDSHFFLLWRHRRTALARHQTLEAALGWSYDLLAEAEQQTLRRLSIFVGRFSLADAQAVAAAGRLDAGEVQEAVAALVARSLLAVRVSGEGVRYRLLDTTRAYARLKLAEAGEVEAAALSHARHIEQVMLAAFGASEKTGASKEALVEVRAALGWCFSDQGDTTVGVGLAAASARLFLKLALLEEARNWTRIALDSFDPAVHGPEVEMALLAAYGLTATLDGDARPSLAALQRGLAVAERVGDRTRSLQFLSGLHALLYRMGDLQASVGYARRCCEVAGGAGDPDALAVSHALLGAALHMMGEHVESRSHIQTALSYPAVRRLGPLNIGSDARSRALSVRARDLWIQGQPDAAVAAARHALEDAADLAHSMTLCMTLLWNTPVFLWCGDVEAAEQTAQRLASEAGRARIVYFEQVAFGLCGEVAMRAGRLDEGVQALASALTLLRPKAYQPAVTWFMGSLAEGRLRLGQLEPALAAVHEALAHADRCGDRMHLPELLRIKGEILAAGDHRHAAEAMLIQAVETAQRQAAPAWELRSAVSLARLWSREASTCARMRPLLAPIHDRFDAGAQTPDLVQARTLLGLAGAPPGLLPAT